MGEIMVTYDDGLCAVEDCSSRGQPQICFYDGKYHHHGKIHYENGHRFHADVHFKEGPWRGICDAHYRAMAIGARAAGARYAR